MSDLTTAQRLAAYRDELIEAGFADAPAFGMVRRVAPRSLDDVELRSDQDDPPFKVGPVTVYMLAKVDEESIAKAAEEIKWALQGAISEDGAPTNV